ncbi:ATP-dependent DNA helicase [Helicobacter sp. 16-1353]|nr:ATP-dependent DNA helicase [Helicobacter sp. 16-1353]
MTALLNKEQLDAASAPLGHNLIIASAGTGKTSTIVGRIVHLLQSGISADKIMLLTFTNKASSEMIKRLESHFSKDILKDIQAGTFHAIAYRYLKEHYKILLKQPRELKILLRSIYNNRIFNEIASTPPYKADYLYDLFSLYINSFDGKFVDFIAQRNEEHSIYADIYDDIFNEFMDLKRQYNYVSYDDLLILYRDKIIENNLSLKEILVDEYQDTNHLQNSIILNIKAESLFCVGDYDQSIYAFNGSDIGIIASFKDRFSDARIFSLTKNYRSSGKILEVANNVIAHNPRIYPKSLEVICKREDSKVEVFSFSDTKEQYQYIARHISTSATSLLQTAIIFRNNISSDYMEASLRELGISVRKKGGRSFFESKEISLLIDILNLFFNKLDMMAFINVLSIGSGIGESIAKDIYDCLIFLGNGNIKDGLLNPKDSNKPYKNKLRNAQLGLFDDIFIQEDRARFDRYLSSDFASHLLLSHPKLTSKSAVFINKFYKLFLIKRDNLDNLFKEIINSDFFAEIKNSLSISRVKNKYKSINDIKIREEKDNIDKKVSILYNLSKSYNDLGRFLNSITLNSAESSSGDGVNLLTIHASKGLEFDDVYIIDLMDGRFPNTKLMSKTGSLEEERRLFYVATTRARHNVYFTFAYKDWAKNTNYTPSIFLKEAKLVR